MTALIDLSIVNSPTNMSYQAAALASAQAFPNDVNLFSVDNASSILEARLQVFANGSAPYVSWLDGDDTVTNLGAVTAALNSSPIAIFTNSNITDATGAVQRQYFPPSFKYDQRRFFSGYLAPKPLIVIKRAVLPPIINSVQRCAASLGQRFNPIWPADLAIYFEVALRYDWTYLKQVCYNWRVYSDSQPYITGAQLVNPILLYYQNEFKG